MRETKSLDSEFFTILTQNRADQLDAWVGKATLEQRRESFLQSVRMGWIPGVAKMAVLVGTDAIDHGVTFAVAGNHFDALKFLVPLATPKHLAGDAITYAVDQNSIEAVQLFFPHLPQMIRDVVLVRAAGQGCMEIVDLLRPGCGAVAINNALVQAAKEGYTDVVKKLASHRNFKIAHTTALISAAQGGWRDTVDFLRQLCDQEAINHAFNTAAGAGRIDIVKQLLPYSDRSNTDSKALTYAAAGGFAECVQLLIPLSDPLSNHSAALRDASKYGHLECVKLLIPVSDPKANESEALYDALVHGNMDCAEILGLVCDPHAVLLQLKDEDEDDFSEYGYANFIPFLEDMMARQQKQLLEQHIEKRRTGGEHEGVRRKI